MVSRTINNEDVRSTIEYFDDYLPEDDLRLLQRCFYLRIDFEDEESHIDQGEVHRRKRDLDRQHESNAFVVSNLCSAGYYDRERFLRELFKRIDNSDDLGPTDYHEVYKTVLRDEPFSVFVAGHNRPDEIMSLIESKLNGYKGYNFDIDFIDIRAQGGRNRSKLNGIVFDLQNDIDTIQYKTEVDKREVVYRIYPDTVSGL